MLIASSLSHVRASAAGIRVDLAAGKPIGDAVIGSANVQSTAELIMIPPVAGVLGMAEAEPNARSPPLIVVPPL